MPLRLSLHTAPAEEPITLTEAKLNLRLATTAADAITYTADDSQLTSMITAARQMVEIITRRALITQTWDLYLDEWPFAREIKLPMPQLQSVSTFTYTDSDGTEADFTAYTADTISSPGRVVLNYGETWPSVTLSPVNPILIRFVAGYGDAEDVPESIRRAILVLVAHFYENREVALARMINSNIALIPFSVDALLADYRVLEF